MVQKTLFFVETLVEKRIELIEIRYYIFCANAILPCFKYNQFLWKWYRSLWAGSKYSKPLFTKSENSNYFWRHIEFCKFVGNSFIASLLKINKVYLLNFLNSCSCYEIFMVWKCLCINTDQVPLYDLWI